MDFSGATGNRVTYPNPLQGSSIEAAGLWINLEIASENQMDVAGSHDGTANRGMLLQYGAGLGGQNRAVAAGAPSSLTASLYRVSSTNGVILNNKRMIGLGFGSGTMMAEIENSGTTDRPLYVYRDLAQTASEATSQTTMFNDKTLFALGARLTTTGGRMTGKIDFCLVTAHPLTRTQRLKLIESGTKNGIFEVPTKRCLIAVGDSMTRGDTGASLSVTRTPQLAYIQDSAWRGGLYYDNAQSGGAISVQEGLFAEILPYLSTLKSYEKFVMFWGGYNSTIPAFGTDAQIESLVERYISMAIQARAAGAQSIHWSRLIGRNNNRTTDASVFERSGYWNSYYEQRCNDEGFIWYDHRLTFDNDEFDGDQSLAEYYVTDDTRHLNELGQATLVSDFISRFPTPVNPFHPA